MIAQLPADRMPPPRPTAISRFARLFRVAARLEIDKADIKRHGEFVSHKIYDLLLRGEANARANGHLFIEPHDLPIAKGLQESIHLFREIDEEIELQPILDHLANRPPFELEYSEETQAKLPTIAGGISVALARAFKLIDPDLKKPQTKHWERAFSIFDLLL